MPAIWKIAISPRGFRQLEVVLRNLIANAFDAVAECPADDRHVEISVAMEGGSVVCISIEDSGPGFDEARLQRVFEGFHSTKSSGPGLGLIISRAIADVESFLEAYQSDWSG